MTSVDAPTPRADARPQRLGSERLTAAASVVTAGLVLGGCSFWSPDITLEPYAPSDGLNAQIGDLLVRNILIVSQGDGEPGVLSGALVNRSDEDLRVLVEVAETTVPLSLEAGESVYLSEDGRDQVVIETVEPISGGLLDVTITNEDAGSETLEVIVVAPLPPYETITPSP